MVNELAAEGRDVHVVAINKTDGVDKLSDLTSQCSYPVLQDTSDAGVWDAMDGVKDDFYIYDAGGLLVNHFRTPGDVDTNLATPAGYDNLKSAILAADQ